jgi:hypothetical protein
MRTAFGPNAVSMPCDDFLGNGQAHAGTGNIPPVQALKHPKDSNRLFLIKTDAIVGHRNDPFAVSLENVNSRRLAAK